MKNMEVKLKDKKQRNTTLLVGGIIVLLILSLGLGLGLGLNSEETTKTTTNTSIDKPTSTNKDPNKEDEKDKDKEPIKEITPDTPKVRYTVVKKDNPNVQNQTISTLKIEKGTTLAQFREQNQLLKDNGVIVNNMNFIDLPFSIKEEIKEELSDTTLGNSGLQINFELERSIGVVPNTGLIFRFVLSKENYDEKKDYSAQDIVEVNFPDNITKISDNQFKDNQITGKLSLPKNLVSIGDSAFSNNKIEELYWDEAVNLKTIGVNAFNTNNFKKPLNFSKTIPQNLETIGSGAFIGATISLISGEVTLPPSLDTIGVNAIPIKGSGIIIYANNTAVNSNGINSFSFQTLDSGGADIRGYTA